MGSPSAESSSAEFQFIAWSHFGSADTFGQTLWGALGRLGGWGAGPGIRHGVKRFSEDLIDSVVSVEEVQ
jgi:hypothetical protein